MLKHFNYYLERLGSFGDAGAKCLQDKLIKVMQSVRKSKENDQQLMQASIMHLAAGGTGVCWIKQISPQTKDLIHSYPWWCFRHISYVLLFPNQIW